jgi:hypothetical protein
MHRRMCSPHADFGQMQKALEDRGIAPVSAEQEYVCLAPTELTEDQATAPPTEFHAPAAGRSEGSARHRVSAAARLVRGRQGPLNRP